MQDEIDFVAIATGANATYFSAYAATWTKKVVCPPWTASEFVGIFGFSPNESGEIQLKMGNWRFLQKPANVQPNFRAINRLRNLIQKNCKKGLILSVDCAIVRYIQG